MRQTREIMGMPITIEIIDEGREGEMEAAFSTLCAADERFSTYKPESEISRINRGELAQGQWSEEMREVMALAERTKQETDGYFDIRLPPARAGGAQAGRADGTRDPSGLVKGWAIKRAAHLLAHAGVKDFYINAGGDIASHGANADGGPWSVGIENPFNREEIVKVIYPRGKGVATSGNYLRGNHIYDPHRPLEPVTGVVSLAVIGPDVCEADRYATAAFAMGKRGIAFIEEFAGFEGYLIDEAGRATLTSGFADYTLV